MENGVGAHERCVLYSFKWHHPAELIQPRCKMRFWLLLSCEVPGDWAVGIN